MPVGPDGAERDLGEASAVQCSSQHSFTRREHASGHGRRIYALWDVRCFGPDHRPGQADECGGRLLRQAVMMWVKIFAFTDHRR